MIGTKLLAPRSGPKRLRIAAALVAAVLFAIVPAVQAYCGIGLPVGAPAAASVATDEGDAGHREGCCEAFPDAAIDDRASAQAGAPLVGKLPVPTLPVAHGATAAVFAAFPRRTPYHLPPPEPAFRRFPRLLL